MLKAAVSGVFAFAIGFAATSGWFTGSGGFSGNSYANLPIEEEIVKAAEAANQKRGQVTGNAKFTGASAHGATLVYDYTVGFAPKNFNTTAASDRAQAMMERQVCSGPLTPAMRRGATIVFRYSTDSGRDLFEARVNATVCRLNT